VRREVYPLVGYSLFLPRYRVFQHLATFGQSETVRVGPALSMTFEFPLRALGSSSDSFVVGAGAGFVWAEWDALVELSATPSARMEEGRVVDQVLTAELRGATPAILLGRLVLRATWQGRRNDTGNTLVSLGGDNALRGYRSQEFQEAGANLLRANLEYRTLPLQWRSLHLGGVLFYDAGDVYESKKPLELHHAVGCGLRTLFPQFNRNVFRFDVGIPLDRACCDVLVTFGSGQAVALTAAEVGG
jgi:hypothetical protein